jgi:hemolysin D
MSARRAELEFLPAAQELRDTPPAAAGRALLWAIVGLLAGALAWAAASEVDIIAAAPGRIVPGGRSKLVQPFEAGMIRAIAVRDGDRVRSGQVLIELDDAAAAADASRIAEEAHQAQLDVERLRRLAELASTPAPPPEGETSGMIDPLLAARWRAHLGRLDSLEAEAEQRAAERATAQRQVDKLAALLPFLERRSQDHGLLAERKLVAEQQHRDARQTLTETTEEIEVQRRRVAGAEAALQRVRAQIRETRAAFVQTIAEQLSEAQRRVASLAQEQIKATARLRAHRLTAPVDGTVQQLAVHTVGGVVSPAQTLLVVVPDGESLEVEALLANRDAGFVAPGQAAEVKLDAFPFTRHGTVPAVVELLSRDAVPDDRLGLVYKARVRLAQNHLAHDGGQIALGPGLAATVEIRTGSRRVLDFVLSPLRQHLQEAGRER